MKKKGPYTLVVGGQTMTAFTCKTCKQTKPLTEFYRNHITSTGHESRCKACRNPELVENVRRWRKARGVTSHPANYGPETDARRAKWMAIARGEIPFPEEQ